MLKDEINEIAYLVGERINAALGSDGSQLYNAARHLPRQGGKRMRPFLVVKACQAVGGKVEDALTAAAAIELLHNFTLVHDDIMDNDLLRRGVPTVHTLWGVPMAILAGDLLFAKSINLLLSEQADSDRLRRSAEVLTRATVVLSEGQFMDISFESRSDVLEQEYVEMIYRKTGALFQAAGEMGAIMGGGNDRSIGLLGTYGRSMGIAFQIYDDYLGMTSSEDVLGKTVGNDIREGKKTLIVIKGLATPARGQLLGLLGRRDATKSEIRSLIVTLRKQGVLESTYGMAKEYIARAKEVAEQLPPSPSRGTLVELADYAISRRK